MAFPTLSAVSATALVPIPAHAGHWFAGLLYLAPVAIVVGALVRQSHKDRREAEKRDGGADE